jgi:hypothetical protein
MGVLGAVGRGVMVGAMGAMGARGVLGTAVRVMGGVVAAAEAGVVERTKGGGGLQLPRPRYQCWYQWGYQWCRTASGCVKTAEHKGHV